VVGLVLRAGEVDTFQRVGGCRGDGLRGVAADDGLQRAPQVAVRGADAAADSRSM
jgi:hypothetical protein